MLEAIQLVKQYAPTARLDTCPYDGGEDATGYFIRIGPNGHWISHVRKSPRAAWAAAAQRMRTQRELHELPTPRSAARER